MRRRHQLIAFTQQIQPVGLRRVGQIARNLVAFFLTQTFLDRRHIFLDALEIGANERGSVGAKCPVFGGGRWRLNGHAFFARQHAGVFADEPVQIEAVFFKLKSSADAAGPGHMPGFARRAQKQLAAMLREPQHALAAG